MAGKERTVRVGRPRLPGSAKYVRLRQSVFNLWRERGKTVWGSSRIANLQNIFYIEGEHVLHKLSISTAYKSKRCCVGDGI